MKKNYRNLLVAAAALLATAGANAQSEPTFEIIGFANNSQINKAAANSAANITFTGSTVETASGVYVFGATYSGGYLRLAQNGTVAVERPATSNDVITRVVALGCAFGGAGNAVNTNIIESWSTFNAPTAFEVDPYGGQSVIGAAYNPATQSEVYELDANLSAGYGDSFADLENEGDIETAQDDIKYIKFTVTGSVPFSLFGIRIYTDATSTGVEEVAAAAKTEISSSFIDLTGKPAKATAKGLLIKRTVYDDGSVEYTKKPLQTSAP